MSNIDVIIQKGLQQNQNEDVFSIVYENKKLWIKKARETGSRRFHKFVYGIYKHPLIIPVENKNLEQAVAHESSKIQRLYNLSVSVPKVIKTTNEYFILEDCGPTVNDLMHKHLVDNPMDLFEKIIIELATLHNLKEFHGSSQIKNFTYTDGQVYFIDFEESFNKEIDIKELQFRDLFLFLLSLSRLDIELDYEILIKKYIRLTDNKDVIQKFHTLISKVTVLMKIIKNKTVWKFIDNDTKGIYKLLLQIKDITNS